MDLAARPHITAGIALTSAAVLAAGPMAQHLPDLHVAQQLRQVSVSAINLTGAADSVVDLFAGVENELASLAGGAAAAAVPASLLGGVLNPAAAFNDPLAVNPIQTWVSLFQNAASNAQYLGNLFMKAPFPVAQQVLANGSYYGTEYVSAYQTAANAAVTWIFGTKAGVSLGPVFQAAWSELAAGQVSQAVTSLYNGLWETPFVSIGEPLEGILKILPQVATNLQSGLTYTTGGALNLFGIEGFLGVPNAVQKTLGASGQAIYNAWVAGDPIGVLTNVADLPGATLNGLINGAPSGATITNGILSNASTKGNGPVYSLVNTILPTLTKDIVTPKAQNILGGGSLAAAFQSFANQLMNGWPSLNSITSAISNGFTQTLPALLQGIPSLLNQAGGFISSLGTLIINLLRLL
ncbi:hypothetical protein H7H82_04885 [Mycobacterium heidelbergense]|uniref:hypothetical protein n=1 Tax=Mycobacterium heidelbergense TaxID=53376 RepID=UPI0011533D7E|nr:hypothetical protein [Mycobacterium heidelbergense]MCV7049943.1 hypothetical protein [Mycobacterium heidelbergense]BBZ52422.1 hypothetical protein MHEI_41390 [Mycobacterium heidelbergense]